MSTRVDRTKLSSRSVVALDVSTSSPLSAGEEIALPGALGADTSTDSDSPTVDLHAEDLTSLPSLASPGLHMGATLSLSAGAGIALLGRRHIVEVHTRLG
jgi:hypothetical protein